jgi:HEAT repeat protein
LVLLLLAACGGEKAATEVRGPRPPDPDRVAAILVGLGASTIAKRRAAAQEAAANPALARALVRPLAKALEDESRWVSSPASEALVLAGPAAIEALPELMAALSDEDDYVRWRAAKILAGLGPAAREALPLLERNANAPSETEMGHYWAGVAVERVQGK